MLHGRLAERSTAADPETCERQILNRLVRAQITDLECDRKSAVGPNLVVDGEVISWEELGRMLLPYCGFGLRVEIKECGEE